MCNVYRLHIESAFLCSLFYQKSFLGTCRAVLLSGFSFVVCRQACSARQFLLYSKSGFLKSLSFWVRFTTYSILIAGVAQWFLHNFFWSQAKPRAIASEHTVYLITVRWNIACVSLIVKYQEIKVTLISLGGTMVERHTWPLHSCDCLSIINCLKRFIY